MCRVLPALRRVDVRLASGAGDYSPAAACHKQSSLGPHATVTRLVTTCLNHSWLLAPFAVKKAESYTFSLSLVEGYATQESRMLALGSDEAERRLVKRTSPAQRGDCWPGSGPRPLDRRQYPFRGGLLFQGPLSPVLLDRRAEVV